MGKPEASHKLGQADSRAGGESNSYSGILVEQNFLAALSFPPSLVIGGEAMQKGAESVAVEELVFYRSWKNKYTNTCTQHTQNTQD